MLSGGRYDNLPRKMGKQVGAIGFALSMGLLEERADGGRFDADVLLTYGPDAELAGWRLCRGPAGLRPLRPL